MSSFNVYIVYDPHTNKVIKTFKFFGHADDFIKKGHHDLKWLNKTHPRHKDVLDKLDFTGLEAKGAS